ncbi:recombinase zinc beta ribbon domain-containing protein [Micromonospora arborensis]|uniref:recombinase zinc beta ribbon domain-containing protein n=1 Tax=Micromonospora arborensis TaxID=2116518 RepID=UPI001ABEEB2B|nr:recombinase zinc beta ribbon domain-containing protein [Micromonospora arborensis]
MRWNARDKWVVSKEITRPPLIDDETFEQAQALLTRRARAVDRQERQRRACNPYVFRGMIYCAVCERRMQGQYNHGAAYYRCRFPQEYALANEVEHPRNVYLREDALTDPLDEWLASAFTPDHLDQTITAMCDAQPTDQLRPQTAAAQATIAACDAKLAQYRAALDAGADPVLVSGWITQTQAERARAEADLQTTQQTEPRRMSRTQIADLVRALGDIATVLRDADSNDKAEVYRQLGLRLTYQTEIANGARCSGSQRAPWGYGSCPRGDTTHCPTTDDAQRDIEYFVNWCKDQADIGVLQDRRIPITQGTGGPGGIRRSPRS